MFEKKHGGPGRKTSLRDRKETSKCFGEGGGGRSYPCCLREGSLRGGGAGDTKLSCLACDGGAVKERGGGRTGGGSSNC